MIALTAEHFPEEGRVWDALVRIWEDTEAPEACMVEIVDGIVTVAPPRDVRQNVIVAELSRALYQQALLRTEAPTRNSPWPFPPARASTSPTSLWPPIPWFGAQGASSLPRLPNWSSRSPQ